MKRSPTAPRPDHTEINTRARPWWVSVRAAALQHLSWLVLALIALLAILALVLVPSFRDGSADAWTVLSSGDQSAIREYLRGYGGWAPVVSVLLMSAQVVLAPIPASVVQLSNGVVFGIFGGAALNIIGQMAGATAAFYISRSLGRSVAERFIGRIDAGGVVGRWLDHWGARALFVIRVVPGMPSDFASYLLGLTHMPARTYLTVSLLGYIPQSLAYAWLGDAAIDWFWWIVLAGFGISSVIALVVWVTRKVIVPPVRPAIVAEPGSDA